MRCAPTIGMVAPLCLILLCSAEVGADEVSESYENELQSAGLGIDRSSLTRFLERRSQVQVESAHLGGLIRQMGSSSFTDRQRAFRELVGLGALSVPALREAAGDPDDRPRARLAAQGLALLSDAKQHELTLATARLLAHRHPEDGVEVLLRFLPNVEDPEALEGLSDVILNLVARQEKMPAAILEAVNDKLHLRRGLALDALRSRDVHSHVHLLNKALEDPSPAVQLKAAQGLAVIHDERAITTLIKLLSELPSGQAASAEEELYSIAGDKSPQTTLGTTDASRKQAQQVWHKWWSDQSSKSLIEEVARRTLTQDKREKALALAKQLGDDSFDVRQNASKELISIGPSIAPVLRQLVDSRDPEIRQRARECLAVVDKASGGPLSPVVPRLLAFRKPQGAVQAMLDYLPFVENSSAHESVLKALQSMAYQDKTPNELLVSALTAKDAPVRAAAAHALCQAGKTDMIAKARELLKDPEWTVRMRSALALANLHERSAVPVLIGAIAKVEEDDAYVAQEYLMGLAGSAPPDGTTSGSAQSRSQAWAKWWKDNGDKIQLVSHGTLERRRPFLGYVVAVHTYNGMIAEYDRSGKKRWSITGFNSPRDAVVIGRNRVVALEMNLRQVVDRDLRGRVLNTYQLPNNAYPVDLQVLPNGNRMITAYNQILEVNRSGKTVWNYQRPQNDLRAARRLKNGQTIVLGSSGRATRLSRNGKELNSWTVFNASNVLGYDILPNGNVLVPNKYGNTVEEYDTKGKRIWSATANRPESVHRLPDGTTVVGHGSSPYQLTFLNRAGKTIKTVSTNMRTMNIEHR